MAGKGPEVVQRPYNGTVFADCPDIIDSKKIAVGIVKMYDIYFMLFYKTKNLSAAVGDTEAGVAVVAGQKPVQRQPGSAFIEDRHSFLRFFRAFMVADDFIDLMPAFLHAVKKLIGYLLSAAAQIGCIEKKYIHNLESSR